MTLKRLLLLLKPFDAYHVYGPSAISSSNHKVLKYLSDRTLAHENSINFCQNILRKKSVSWKAIHRIDQPQPIHDVDLVISVGGDGTLLHASHLVDQSIPILGVNSDPTRPEEVDEFTNDFDATRSTGYLCAATTKNFEQLLDDILENRIKPSELARVAVSVNSKPIGVSALNDILLCHPSPASVSRFSFRIKKNTEEETFTSLTHCRSSGLRVSTATGSTAAMHSAGGLQMPIFSKELQFMVREPMLPRPTDLIRGFVKLDETMEITWFCREGVVYLDGSHEAHSVKFGDRIELSSHAPPSNVYLSPHLSSQM